MLSIAERSSDACTVLRHGEGVFHEALELVKKGESRFHAEGPDGTAYDLVYTENMQLFSRQMYMLITQITKGSALYAPFLDYDENDTENICLAFLGQFRRMEIETADEYSIAAARLALRHTDMEIWCRDGRISWFIGESGRLRITEELPEKGGADILRITGNPMEFGYAKRDWSRLCSAAGRGFRHVCPETEEAGENPDHVSVHGRNGNLIGNGGDGPGRVGADAGDPAQLFRIPGQLAAVFSHDLDRPFAEIAGPGIITQALPKFQDFLLRAVRQGGKGGKALQKPAVIGKNRFHPRLLQHCLTDPGPVGVVKSAPGEIPGAAVIPGKKGGRDRIHENLLR